MKMPDLGKQYGPLPLGAWIVVVGAGLGIAYYTRNMGKATSEDATEVEDGSGTPGVGVGPGGGFTPVAPSNPDEIPTAPVTTNEEWGKRAINWLIASGYPPAMSDSAIRKYLAAEKYSIQEFTLITIALGKWGSPPTPLPPNPNPDPVIPVPPPKPVPGPVKPKPVPPKPKPPAPKPTVRYYIVRSGDNLSKIGAKYGKSWQSIYNANRYGTRRADGTPGMIRNPNLIYPNWKLIIPN